MLTYILKQNIQWCINITLKNHDMISIADLTCLHMTQVVLLTVVKHTIINSS